MSLFEDREGTLWIGSYGATTRLRDGRFERMAYLAETNALGLPDAASLAIRQDPDGTMWFGTIKGLVRYRDGTSTLFTTADGLPDIYVQAIYRSRDGTLWVGTQ